MTQKLAALFVLFALAAPALAGQECSNDGHRWVRREQLDPTLAFVCHDDRFKRDLVTYAALRLPALLATERALRMTGPDGAPLFHEGNALMRSPLARIVTSVVVPVGFALWARAADRSTNTDRGKHLRRIGKAWMALDTTWDVYQVAKATR